jgi:molybdate transport repressor ModE-like protein
MNWNDLNLVLAICRSGTLSGAAKVLGINYTTVFRRINAIEKKLEVRLFDRQPTGYVMTEAGEVIKRSAERIDEEVTALSLELLGKDLRLQGTIRITAPEGVALRLLAPHLATFCGQHPDITIELIATSSPLQLSQREADIAVRITDKPPDNYIGREVCKCRFGIYASPAYLQNNKGLSLVEHLWVMSQDVIDFSPFPAWRKKFHAKKHLVFSSNNTFAVIDAAKRGLGVTPIPCFLGDSEPELVRTIDTPEELNLSLWILIHPDLRHTARVKALMTHLLSELENEKSAIEGIRE